MKLFINFTKNHKYFSFFGEHDVIILNVFITSPALLVFDTYLSSAYLFAKFTLFGF